MIEAPSFEDFYRAANAGRSPFPWQARLAERLRNGEGWPSEIGIPTGLGKTSCIDIAIWWLAYEADRDPTERKAPTRIWWLVNRRLLVDAATEHVGRLQRLLVDPEGVLPSTSGADTEHEFAALRAVATRLAPLSARPDAPPIEVVRLRGGVAAARPTDPSQPAILLSTVPMYGSRLLFRGYGVSRSMRPVDAALAGTDSLVLVDEAHLAHHLMHLFAPLGECDRPEVQVLPVARTCPVVVSLTATGSDDVSDRFDLDENDLAHRTVQERLYANKLVTIDERATGADAAKALAGAASELLAGCAAPSSCVVFANTPAVARQVLETLTLAGRQGLVADLLLLTGRSRDRESRLAREHILDPVRGAPADRVANAPRERHLVVVATQTLEVGADLDFDLLVTEACGVRSLTQRLGRLNRLGRSTEARARYVHIPPRARAATAQGWPVYGDEPLSVLERLRQHAVDGTINLCPGRVAEVLGPPGDDPGRAPEILPGLLAEWSKSSQPPAGEAPVEPFFSGLRAPERIVSVAWRAHIPAAGMVLWPRLRDDEAIDLPLGDELRAAIAGLGEVHRLKADRASLELIDPDQLRPGDTLLVPTSAGLLDEYGWNPLARVPIVDISVLREGLPLDPEAIRRISGESLGSLIYEIIEPSDEDDSPIEQRVEELLSRLGEAEPAGLTSIEWQNFLASLSRRPDAPANEVPRLRTGHDSGPLLDELDELSLLSETAVALEAHCKGVGARAVVVANRVGVSPELVQVLAAAGRFHDVGKADKRFQQWLDPYGEADCLVAKSKRRRSTWIRDRIAAGWPEGGRHEALSSRLVRVWLDDFQQAAERLKGPAEDLLLHLVISHHGWGRPLIIPVADEGGGETAVEFEGVTVRTSADLSTTDWTQPVRFHRLCKRYGYWGLAFLEAVVRQADHAVSAGGWPGEAEVM